MPQVTTPGDACKKKQVEKNSNPEYRQVSVVSNEFWKGSEALSHHAHLCTYVQQNQLLSSRLFQIENNHLHQLYRLLPVKGRRTKSIDSCSRSQSITANPRNKSPFGQLATSISRRKAFEALHLIGPLHASRRELFNALSHTK
jgi:hypothetical protein